jgi:MoxR-like ATPase
LQITIEPVLTAEEILELQRTVREVPVTDHVIRYALSLVRQTRSVTPARPILSRHGLGVPVREPCSS